LFGRLPCSYLVYLSARLFSKFGALENNVSGPDDG